MESCLDDVKTWSSCHQHVAAELHVSRQAIYMYDLKRAAARLPSGTTPTRKV